VVISSVFYFVFSVLAKRLTGNNISEMTVAVWCTGNALVLFNEVNLCWVRLILVWVTLSGFDSLGRHFISVS